MLLLLCNNKFCLEKVTVISFLIRLCHYKLLANEQININFKLFYKILKENYTDIMCTLSTNLF